MGLFVAGIGMAARCNPSRGMGSDRLAVLPYPELRTQAKTVIGLQSVESRQKTAIDHGCHEMDV